jgi:hypothetical protein
VEGAREHASDPVGARRRLARDLPPPAELRARVAGHLNDHARQLLYGAVLAAAALTVVSVRPTKSESVAVSIVLTLGAYSLAHLYAEVLGGRVQQPGASLRERLRSGVGYEAAVLEGGLPVLLCFLALRAAGVGVAEAALAASWFTVALLAVIGHRIGRLARVRGVRLAVEVVGAAGIGLLLIVLKTALY